VIGSGYCSYSPGEGKVLQTRADLGSLDGGAFSRRGGIGKGGGGGVGGGGGGGSEDLDYL